MSDDFLYKPSYGIDENFYSEAEFFKREEEEPEGIEEDVISVGYLDMRTKDCSEAVKVFPDEIYYPIKEVIDGVRYVISTIKGEERKQLFENKVIEDYDYSEVRGVVLIEYLDIFRNKIREDKRITNVFGNVFVSGDRISGYELLKPVSQSVEVLENREYLIRFVYAPISDQLKRDGIYDEDSIKDPPEFNLGGMIVIEYFDTHDNRIRESKVLINQSGYKEITADFIRGYECKNPTIVSVDIKGSETVTVRFVYERLETPKEPIEKTMSGTIIISYKDIRTDEKLRNDLFVSETLGGTYFAPEISKYTCIPPTSEKLLIVYDEQTINHTFYYAELFDDETIPTYPEPDEKPPTYPEPEGLYPNYPGPGFGEPDDNETNIIPYEDPEYETDPFDDDLIINDDTDPDYIFIDITRNPKPIIIKNNYDVHLTNIINDFIKELNSIIARYISEVESIMEDFNFPDSVKSEIIRKKYEGYTGDVFNMNYKHISDIVLSNQIKSNQRERLFKKLFNKAALQKQLRSCKLATELRARYYEAMYPNTENFSDLIRSSTLAEKRFEYDEKYKQSFLDFYKLLNSALSVLASNLSFSIKEIQGKAILIGEADVRLKKEEGKEEVWSTRVPKSDLGRGPIALFPQPTLIADNDDHMREMFPEFFQDE